MTVSQFLAADARDLVVVLLTVVLPWLVGASVLAGGAAAVLHRALCALWRAGRRAVRRRTHPPTSASAAEVETTAELPAAEAITQPIPRLTEEAR